MKAVILAAGQGTRLMPLTADRPKCLVELNGRPLLEWQIDALRAGGIEEIIVVTGYKAEKIDLPGIRKIHNPRFATTNMVVTLFEASKELEGDVLICYSDIVYSSQVVSAMIANQHQISVAVDLDWQKLWELRMEDPLSDAETLKMSPQGEILELGKKPNSLDEIQGQYIGMIGIRSKLIAKVSRFYDSLDRNASYEGRDFDNMFMTAFLTEIMANLSPIHSTPIHGQWCEVDSVEDLDAYQRAGLPWLQANGYK